MPRFVVIINDMLFMLENMSATAVAPKSKIIEFGIELNKNFTALFVINKHTHTFCVNVLACK